MTPTLLCQCPDKKTPLSEPGGSDKGGVGLPDGAISGGSGVLLDAGNQPAAIACAWLGEVPDFVDGFRRCVGFLAQQACEADADDVPGGFLGYVDDFGVQRDHVGLLLCPGFGTR